MLHEIVVGRFGARAATRAAAHARGDAPMACSSSQPPGSTTRLPDR